MAHDLVPRTSQAWTYRTSHIYPSGPYDEDLMTWLTATVTFRMPSTWKSTASLKQLFTAAAAGGRVGQRTHGNLSRLVSSACFERGGGGAGAGSWLKKMQFCDC